MTILNTTFIVADDLLDQFLQWARQTYVPSLLGSGVFESPTMAKVLTQVEPGATSVAIQAMSDDPVAAARWHDGEAALLKENLTAAYRGRILFFTTYMEVL